MLVSNECNSTYYRLIMQIVSGENSPSLTIAYVLAQNSWLYSNKMGNEDELW